MSDQGEALRQAIADEPEADAPRLVYADWLDDHGDSARAEFIRVQIERTRLPPDDDRQAELTAREKELEDRHRHAWLRTMPKGVLSRPFVRGFPESVGFVRSDWQQWQLSRDDLASLTEAMERLPIRTFKSPLLGCRSVRGGIRDEPSWRDVFPPEGESGLELLAQWPFLRRLTTLDVGYARSVRSERGDFTPGLRALALSSYALGITDLSVDGWIFQPEIFQLLGSSEQLLRLCGLKLAWSRRPTVALALARLRLTPLETRLRRLDCRWTPIPSAHIRRMLDWGALTDLHFNLGEETVAEGVGPLLGAPKLAALRVLGLTGEEHGFDHDEMPEAEDHRQVPGLRELLSSPLLAGLKELSLGGIDLGDDGARALADSLCARNLIALRLDLYNLTGAGLRALRSLLAEGRLRRLSLGHNPLTDADATELASWPEFGRLHEVELGEFNYLDDKVGGKAALRESPHRHRFLRLS